MRVDAVKESGKPDDKKHARYAQQLRQLVGEGMLQAYVTDIKQRATIKVNLPEVAPAQP